MPGPGRSISLPVVIYYWVQCLEENRRNEMLMIDVIKLEYWDGAKFILRKDKPDWKTVLNSARKKMREKFLSLPPLRQRSLSIQWSLGKGQMVKKTETTMSESDYLKITKA